MGPVRQRCLALRGKRQPEPFSVANIGKCTKRKQHQDIHLLFHDTKLVRRQHFLYEFLTATEYLDFVADVRGIVYEEKKERITRLIEALDLEGKQGETMTGYSQGMKQRVAIMGAILHHPKILLMDEPLNGLDPKSARVVKELIHSLARDGVTTIFSTHVLEIAEAICDRLTILQSGRILAEGTAQELREKAGLSNSGLEDVFLKLTGTKGVEDIVEALRR